ncbi:hypothetical protein HDU76_013346 [Blyttiomyces sp. JEL0837]|nr:hypothetical protein HDU76_013346 [Blyttiomyces sp. JEL0837]
MVSTTSTNATSTFNNNYYSSEWIDFRIQITGSSPDVPIIRTFYLIHSIASAIILAFGLFVIHIKLVSKNLSPFRWSGNTMVPRGPESWVVASTQHSSSATLPSPTHGGVTYVFALIHATPKRVGQIDGADTPKVFLPSLHWLGIYHSALMIMPWLNPIISVIGGAAADKGDYMQAADMVRGHYITWSVMCFIFLAVIYVFGKQLVKLLRYNMAFMRKNELAEETVRHSIHVMIFTMLSLGLLGLIFAVILGSYAFFRVEIHSHLVIDAIFAALWIFSPPILILGTYIGMCYSVYFNNKIASRHSESQSTNNNNYNKNNNNNNIDSQNNHSSHPLTGNGHPRSNNGIKYPSAVYKSGAGNPSIPNSFVMPQQQYSHFEIDDEGYEVEVMGNGNIGGMNGNVNQVEFIPVAGKPGNNKYPPSFKPTSSVGSAYYPRGQQ